MPRGRPRLDGVAGELAPGHDALMHMAVTVAEADQHAPFGIVALPRLRQYFEMPADLERPCFLVFVFSGGLVV